MIVVNSSTRQFNIPGADLVFGVTADGGSENKYFQCPRYVGNNVDIASSFVRINYRNANGEIDYHLIEDVSVDGDNVLFSWELHEKVTAYKGQVSFVMCVVGADTKVKWHTTLGKGQVLEGLEPDWESALAETDDGLAQLLAMVEAQTEAVENKGAEWVRNVQSEGTDQIIAVQTAARESREAAVAEIEAKGVNVRGSIPDDYTALSEAVDSVVKGRAGVIVCSAEGSAVVVNDASDMAIQGMKIFGRSTQDGTPTPDAPVEIKSVVEPVVTVCGKNLLKNEAVSNTFEGITFTVNADGSITVNGTATAVSPLNICKNFLFKAGVTYKLTGCPIGGGITTYRIDNVGVLFDDGEGGSITCGVDTNAEIRIRIAANATVENLTFYPMIRVASVGDDTYEPYSGQTLPTTHTLPGIPVTSGGNYTDSDGQQWICDEVDLERGVYVQRVFDEVVSAEKITSVDNSVVSNGGSVVYFSQTHPHRADDNLCLVVSDRCLGVSSNTRGIQKELYRCYAPMINPNAIVFRYPISEGNKTLAEAKEKFSGFKVQYALATPIETALSETEIAAYRALHSNYPNTTVLNDAGAHMVVKYAADTKLYIDNKIAALVGG